MEVTRCANGGSTSHIGKKQAVQNGVDGTPIATASRVDAHDRTIKKDRAKFVLCCDGSHAQETAGTDAVLVRKNAGYGSQNGWKITEEGLKRQEENPILKNRNVCSEQRGAQKRGKCQTNGTK